MGKRKREDALTASKEKVVSFITQKDVKRQKKDRDVRKRRHKKMRNYEKKEHFNDDSNNNNNNNEDNDDEIESVSHDAAEDAVEVASEEDDDADVPSVERADMPSDDENENDDDDDNNDAAENQDHTASHRSSPLGTSFATILARLLSQPLSTTEKTAPVLCKFHSNKEGSKLLVYQQANNEQLVQKQKNLETAAVRNRGRETLSLPQQLNFEKQLKRIARMGVVKLFNTVTKSRLEWFYRQKDDAKRSWLEELKKAAAAENEDDAPKKWNVLSQDVSHFSGVPTESKRDGKKSGNDGDDDDNPELV